VTPFIKLVTFIISSVYLFVFSMHGLSSMCCEFVSGYSFVHKLNIVEICDQKSCISRFDMIMYAYIL